MDIKKLINKYIEFMYLLIMTCIATMYYERDLSMNLDPECQIKESLEKLGYLNTDCELVKKIFIKNKLLTKLSLEELDIDLSISELINQIKNSSEYLLYCQNLDNNKKRGDELKKHLLSTDIKSFYDSCTEEELEYIGY